MLSFASDLKVIMAGLITVLLVNKFNTAVIEVFFCEIFKGSEPIDVKSYSSVSISIQHQASIFSFLLNG